MRPVKTRPRFRCDFCRYAATRAAVERHEQICWMNPDRHCLNCDGRGYHEESYDLGASLQVPCYFCSKRDPVLAPLPESAVSS